MNVSQCAYRFTVHGVWVASWGGRGASISKAAADILGPVFWGHAFPINYLVNYLVSSDG